MIFLLGAEGFLGKAICLILEKHKLKYAPITRKNYKRFIGKSCNILINSSTNSKNFYLKKILIMIITKLLIMY